MNEILLKSRLIGERWRRGVAIEMARVGGANEDRMTIGLSGARVFTWLSLLGKSGPHLPVLRSTSARASAWARSASTPGRSEASSPMPISIAPSSAATAPGSAPLPLLTPATTRSPPAGHSGALLLPTLARVTCWREVPASGWCALTSSCAACRYCRGRTPSGAPGCSRGKARRKAPSSSEQEPPSACASRAGKQTPSAAHTRPPCCPPLYHLCTAQPLPRLPLAHPHSDADRTILSTRWMRCVTDAVAGSLRCSRRSGSACFKPTAKASH